MHHYKLLLILLALGANAMPLPDGQSSQCAASYSGSFGFITTKPGSSGSTSQGGDGQPSSGGTTQMQDGQPNSGGATQLADGQPNSGGATQLPDGQPNTGGVTQLSDGQPNSGGATQLPDGQPNSGGVTQLSDGQPNSGGATELPDGQPNSGGATELPDGQPNSGGATELPDGQPNSATQMGDGQANGNSSGGPSQTACMADNSLVLTLNNGVLMDSQGRTGYIASNFQFQFDNPPQSGHLETSGFSICNGNQLALNGNTEWWMCKSGDFYNLYSKNWAAQCEPTTFTIVKQTKC